MAILALLGTPNDSVSTTSGMAEGIVGTNMASSTVKRTGAYSMRLVPTAAQSTRFGLLSGSGKKASIGSAGPIYVSFYLYISNPPTGDVKLMSFGASTTYGTTELARLEYVQSDDTLQLVGSTTSSKTAALTGATWYRVDIDVTNAGTCHLSLNQATAVTCTGAANNCNYVHVGTDGTDASLSAYFDDMVIADAAITTSDYHIGKLSPNADGYYTAWTASTGNKWDCVDEIPDSATDYISSGTGAGDQRYSAALESASTGGIESTYTIHAVQAEFRMWEVSSTTTSGAVGIRGGSTDTETTNVDIGSTTNIIMGLVRETNPDDSAAWEPSDLDGIELIVKRSTSDTSNIRCGWMVLEVMYTIVSEGSGTLAVPAQTVAGTGVTLASGTSALIVPVQTLAGTGAHTAATASGTGALSLAMQVLSATGTHVDIQGSGALAVAMQQLSGAGSHSSGAEGTGALVLVMQVLDALGSVPLVGIGTLAQFIQTLDGDGKQAYIGTGALNLWVPVIDGVAKQILGGTGALTLWTPELSGSGKQIIPGTGSFIVPIQTLSGVGGQVYSGTGTIILPQQLLDGIAYVILPPVILHELLHQIPIYQAELLIPIYSTTIIIPKSTKLLQVIPTEETLIIPFPDTVRLI